MPMWILCGLLQPKTGVALADAYAEWQKIKGSGCGYHSYAGKWYESSRRGKP